VVAATFHMLNVGRFDWPAAGKAVGMAGLMYLLWSSTRSKAARRADQTSASPPAGGPPA
jgi:threonine/homoserine/homoserine lactone efflux protein